jgi:uncharacterized membrane protein SirB2
MYEIVKIIHVGCAMLTLVSFSLRGIWMLHWPGMLKQAAVRIVPHVIDAVLLASAIVLMIQTRQYPLAQTWLTAKIAAVVVYIVLGSVALKRGRTRAIRISASVGALATYGYIVAVALTHDALPLRMFFT